MLSTLFVFYSNFNFFFDCVLFGKRAQGLSDYLVKGMKVAIKGHLRQDRWESDAGKRSKVVIIVDEVEIITPKKQDNEVDDIPW